MHKLIQGLLQKGLKHLAWLLAAAIAVIVPVAYATDITTTDGYTYDSTLAPAATIVATAASTSITDTTAPPNPSWHVVVSAHEKIGNVSFTSPVTTPATCSASLLAQVSRIDQIDNNVMHSMNSDVSAASQGGLACELV